MADRPSVSAIIPAYNAERFIAEAVESVLTQTHDVLECIVVDDGSRDGTAELARAYGPPVRVLSQENRGVSASRNRGAAESRSEALAFLDADDRWRPNRVRAGVEALAASPGAEAVVCATEVVDRGLRPIGVIAQKPGLTAEELLLWNSSVVSASSNLLIKREAFEAIGGFDESLSTSADWALTFRLLERRRLLSVPEPLVEYRRHEANMSADVDRFARDMLGAYDAVFGEATPSIRPLRRRAYANLHRTIAGSYFVEGEIRKFARHAALSLRTHPSTFPYFAGMPLRRLVRRLRRRQDPLGQ